MRRWLTLCTLGALALALALALPALAATASQPAQGTQQDTPGSLFFVPKFADGNVVAHDGVLATAWTGTFTGAATEEWHGLIQKSGRVTYQASITFVGTAGTCGSGTVRFVGQAHGVFPLFYGHYGTIDQHSATVRVHAELDFVYNILTGQTLYEGSYHCR